MAAEGGYRWTTAAGRPWLRAGASHASGDDDPGDDRHGTFFPMLQDTRTYALSMVYAHMNLRDVFAAADAEPHPRARLRAATCTDWPSLESRIAGIRAAARRPEMGTFFGYSSRPSGGGRGLGTVLEGIRRRAAVALLVGQWLRRPHVGRPGGARHVRGDRLFYWYVENVLRLMVPRPSVTPPP